jgi:hypothetical protein
MPHMHVGGDSLCGTAAIFYSAWGDPLPRAERFPGRRESPVLRHGTPRSGDADVCTPTRRAAPRPPSAHVSRTGTGDPLRVRGPGVALSSRLVRVVALRSALRESLLACLVNLIVTPGLATDAPHEGSGSTR